MNGLTATIILSQVRYKNWRFYIWDDGGPDFWLQVIFPAPCSKTGEPGEQKGRKWRLSPYMTKSELVQTALMAVLAAEEHEARENFLYKGHAIFGPHHDVDDLVRVREEKRP